MTDSKTAGTTPSESEIIDPADEHYEQSHADHAAYQRAMDETEMPFDYRVEPNYEQFGRGGNPWSRQGFDFDSFRDRG